MFEADIQTVLQRLVTVILPAEVEPTKAAVQDAPRQAASTPIEKISDCEYLIWNLSCSS